MSTDAASPGDGFVPEEFKGEPPWALGGEKPQRTPTQPFRPDGSNRLGDGWRNNHPLYLLSAACMLAGCLVVQSAIVGGNILDVFNLGLTVLMYEALLFAVVYVLFSFSGTEQHRGHLMVLVLLFGIDPTFTYFRLQVSNPTMGAILCLAVSITAAGKGWLMYRRLQGNESLAMWRSSRWPALAAVGAYGLCMVLAFLPAVFGGRYGSDSMPGLYLMWWLAAGVVVLTIPQLFLVDVAGGDTRSEIRRLSCRRYWRRYVFALPLVMGFTRLLLLHWLFPAPFDRCFLAPMCLALACVGRWILGAKATTARTVWAAIWIVVAAYCAGSRDGLQVVGWGWVGPWRTVLCLTAAVVAGFAIQRLSWWRLGFAAVLGMTAALGSTPTTAWRRLLDGMGWSIQQGLPQTRMGWGLLGIGLAFGLLILGLIWNLAGAHRPVDADSAHQE